MSPQARQHWTIAGIVGAATLVIASLGSLANGVISLDHKAGASTTAQDSLFHNDSLLFSRVARLERIGRIKPAGRAAAQPKSEGLVRRVFHLLF